MKRNLTLLVMVFFITSLVASLSSCAQHQVAEQKVEKEIKEVTINPSESTAVTAREFIMKSDKLTDSQKKKLLELQEKTHALSDALKEEIEKTKIVLIQTVLEPKMNEREFAILKKKISKLEKKRMENGFNAIADARKIIEPRKNIQGREFYQSLLHNHLQEF
ncbi:MAG: hypothetical protein PHY93_03140 [Bacteriovorax sp.]|nr:hypothetical protein [Bacteriovorax sp.]